MQVGVCMIRHRMADLSERTKAANARAVASTKRLRSVAQRLTAEMDAATPPHGIKVTEFDEEDSLVTSIEAVFERRDAAAGGHKH